MLKVTELNSFIFGLILGVILAVSSTIVINNYSADYLNPEQYHAFNERTNNTINGVWFPHSSFCIDMSRKNIDDIMKTYSHEFLHELIEKNHSCGNESCYNHFCN